MTRRLAVLISTTAMLMFGGTSCGSDDRPVNGRSAKGPSGDSGLTVIAKDISLFPATFRAGAGDVHVTYRNEGSIQHTLLIDGVDGFKLDVAAKGDVDDGSVTLAPGSYTLYCDVAGHREAGMEASLTIK